MQLKQDKIRNNMTYRTVFFSAVTLLFTSCGGSSNEASEGMKALEGVKDIVSNADNVAERQKELSEMEPMSKEGFLQWAPESVLGLPKEESTEKHLPYDEYRYSGYFTVYSNNDKTIRFEIFDGAGSMIYSRYAGMLSTDALSQERENYYEKNIERDGIMVNEWHNSERNDCGLMFIVEDRFVVSIKGEGFSPDEIWKNLEDFKLSEL